MSINTAAEWLAQTMSVSEKMEAFMLTPLPDDTCGWGKSLSAMWTIEAQKRPSGLLLTGPDGCGKHTIAAQMLSILVEEDFRAIFLSWSDLAADSFQAAKGRLDSLLDHFYQEGWPLCLILEQTEQCPCRQELLTYLGQTLLEYRLQPEALPPLFLILIDQQEAQIPSILRRSLRLCRVTLPGPMRRMHYLDRYAASLGAYLPLDQIAEAAEGVTFAQLRDLVLNLENLLDSADCFLPDEVWKTFVEEQLPPAAPEDAMKILSGTVHQLFRELPGLLSTGLNAPVRISDTPVHVPSASVPPAEDEAEEPLTLDNVANAPPIRLHCNIFTEEQQEQILHAFDHN